MYRDDPLDDELELRALLGDDAIDALCAQASHPAPVERAIDVLRLLQGWVDEPTLVAWFVTPQDDLDGHSPLSGLAAGRLEEVEDAARLFAAEAG